MLGSSEIHDSWLEVHLAALSGIRRIHEAIPALLAKFHPVTPDFASEKAIEALARIGDAVTVNLILKDYPTADDDYRLMAIPLLGRLKFPESEAAILEILNSETDQEHRAFLCQSLCLLLSEHALEAVHKEISQGSQAAFREVGPLALTVAEMLGQELPKSAVQWMAEKRRQEEQMKKALSTWRNPNTDHTFPLDDIQEIPDPEVEVTSPIRKAGRHVGRNDPCPCGSGKKFKKCCGRSV
jgi:uncharacterized protein YchJ